MPPATHEMLEEFILATHAQAHPARMELAVCSPKLSVRAHIFKLFNARLLPRSHAPVSYNTFIAMLNAL